MRQYSGSDFGHRTRVGNYERDQFDLLAWLQRCIETYLYPQRPHRSVGKKKKENSMKAGQAPLPFFTDNRL